MFTVKDFLIPVVLSLIASELVCFGWGKISYEPNTPTSSEELDKAFESELGRFTPEYIATLRTTSYDPVVGFVEPRGTTGTTTNTAKQSYTWNIDQNGSRHTKGFDTSDISVYGDSFSFGDEVNDDETYAAYISDALKTNVLNFGLRGGAPDLAILRIEKNRRDGIDNSKVTVLGVYSENITRIGVSFIGFYMKGTFGFKPQFVGSNGDYHLIPNPIAPFQSQADLRRAYDIAKRYDYWYQRIVGPPMHFPFTLSAIQAVQHLRFQKTWHILTSLYDDPGFTDKMEYILTRFVELGEEFHFKPIIVFIPTEADSKEQLGGSTPGYRTFVKQLRARLATTKMFPAQSVIDVWDHQFDWSKFNIVPFGGHLSPAGHQFIADLVLDVLEHPTAAFDASGHEQESG